MIFKKQYISYDKDNRLKYHRTLLGASLRSGANKTVVDKFLNKDRSKGYKQVKDYRELFE